MPTRPPQKRSEDIFFLAMVLLILIVNFIGFAQTYYLAGVFRAPLPNLIVHLHGALFTSWLLLLLTQTVLVSLGRIRWHRRLGILAGVIASAMLVVGPLALVAALRRHAFSFNGANLVLAGDIGGLILFALFVAWGLLRRNESLTHKRLMLFSTIAILLPALSRWPFAFMDGPGFVAIYMAFPLAVIVFDLFTLRKIHRVTLVASLLVTLYLFGAEPLSHTALWHRLTLEIAGSPWPMRP